MPFTIHTDEERTEWAAVRGMLRKNPPSGFAPLELNIQRRRMSARMEQSLARMLRARPSLLGMRDIDGRTALHWIARYDAPGLIQTLLTMGADPMDSPTPPTCIAATPLSEAASLSWGPGLVLLARAAGVDAQAIPGKRTCEPLPRDDASDYERASQLRGASALHVAAMNCNLRALEDLLAIGANPMLPDDEGLKALHPLCIHSKKIEHARPCADLLLSVRPELLHARCASGHLPHELAEAQKNPLGAYLRSRAEELSIAQAASAPPAARTRPRPL
jgi:ankyrin repeat protein